MRYKDSRSATSRPTVSERRRKDSRSRSAIGTLSGSRSQFPVDSSDALQLQSRSPPGRSNHRAAGQKLHEQAPDPEHLRLRLIAGIAADGRLFVAAGGFDLRAIIRRWVLGFHAALYAFGWSQTHPEHGSVPTRSICMGGSIWATSIDLVAVAVSGCTSEPMGRFLTTASEATGIPTTTNQMTRWIRFR